MLCLPSHDHPEGHIILVHTKGLYGLTDDLTLNLNFRLCNDPPIFSYRDMVRLQSYNLN